MPLTALLLDLDGTLVDTNPFHVEAYRRAFRDAGYDVEDERIARAVGMGGDKLVPALLGEDGERAHGDAVREAVGRLFTEELAPNTRLRLFEGAEALIAEARRLGLRTAIATSAEDAFLDAIFASVGTDLREQVDAVTTASDVDASKPDPDVVGAALERLGVPPEEAALVGDTRFDIEAALGAGVLPIGVTSWVWTRAAFEGVGAAHVYTDLGGLIADLGALAGAEGGG